MTDRDPRVQHLASAVAARSSTGIGVRVRQGRDGQYVTSVGCHLEDALCPAVATDDRASGLRELQTELAQQNAARSRLTKINKRN